MEKEDQDLIKCFDDVLSMVGEDQHDLQEKAATDISKVPKTTETMTTDLTPEEIESHQTLEQMKVLFPSILVPWLKKCVDARLKDRWQSERIASWIFDNLNVAPREEKAAEQTRLLATDMEAQKARIMSSVRKVDNSYIFNAKYKLCEKFNRLPENVTTIMRRLNPLRI
uniref:Uncharacterized protein n=1 Tax=Romanomermis culicivorax TaxID=13658 RepID=A0A915KC35_ROMCU